MLFDDTQAAFVDTEPKSRDGNGALTASPEVSEKGFGERLPAKSPHGQSGSMKRQSVLRAMLHDQGFACALSGVPLTPETATLDHVIPVAENGHPTDARNGQWVHGEVNRMKGTMSQEAFIDWCKKAAANVPVG